MCDPNLTQQKVTKIVLADLTMPMPWRVWRHNAGKDQATMSKSTLDLYLSFYLYLKPGGMCQTENNAFNTMRILRFYCLIS